MGDTKLVLNTMVSLVKDSRVNNDTFKWDDNDRSRLVMLMINSNKILQESCLLEFLTQCDMMTHDMLSSLLMSEKLKFDEILMHLAETSNISDKAKLKLFLKLVKDNAYELDDDSKVEQVCLYIKIVCLSNHHLQL